MKLIFKKLYTITTAFLIFSGSVAYSQNNMALDNTQKYLSAIAALEAKGDIKGLSDALNRGFDNGLTISKAKEALSHLYAYTGFPRSLNALGCLQQVIADRKASVLSYGSAVSLLLNMTDGILADDLNIKFICTFNDDMK
ncbi:MAG: carboxymuconolactone decarboxylase family protein, partial [Bacteroidales bacterium]|nr:carboxymuconolactone decarboxylase family protein [Bacteroidales bacterium]